ncbi:tryptophan 2,3-dioxygenase [Pyrinomonas methylaliphatogenes]|uniref:Tryptophan 2,3-dioxygenase n=1 Tax=Pyrinomonas methylaliphatogenes TaxID=454194 RepID=A0A0B6X0T1_9BACT|nr:tryptophan 2,3-dioxygenase family protein [Pyrinomonas methylaliphatogenes]CDM66961.1 tryptophan 2,3-dioxygenase (vermilion) [Pyrinomonas methylaliphatogenes]
MAQDDYGRGAPLSYNRYLRVRELIALQECLSTPPHHDELLFIITHQTYELWFKQILHEIDASIAYMDEMRVVPATRALERVVEIEKLLLAQLHILETMTPFNFLEFRDRLKPASGFQSMQFREIEFVSGLKDEGLLASFGDDELAVTRLRARLGAPTLGEAFFALLKRRGFDAPEDDPTLPPEERRGRYERRVRALVELLSHHERFAPEFHLAEKLIEHDEYFQLWRAHHVRMVERMVGTKRGTGGSEGVRYLRTTLDQKFIPELWEARTHLELGHGEPD